MAPTWNPRNLNQHHRERLQKDPGCFEDLLGLAMPMTEAQYETRSHDVVTLAPIEYECESRDVGTGQFRKARVYYVDDELVVAVTDGFRREFITCFHEHFSRRHASPASIGTVGQRRLRYKELLQF